MHEICKDVFEDDVILVPETSKKPTDKENLNLNTQSPNSILKEDHFMPVEQIESPYLLPAEYNQQCVESLNIDSAPTPLDTSTFISELSPLPQPTSLTNDNLQTPMPSPAKNHTELFCDDVFCPTHDYANYINCPSVNTVASSCMSSPAPVVRCRGKKRLRHYNDWVEVKRKRLKNEGKTYRSKKGKTILEKTMGRSCTWRYKCDTKLTVEERQDAFKKFWKLGSREKQWLHVANYTTKEKKEKRPSKRFKA